MKLHMWPTSSLLWSKQSFRPLPETSPVNEQILGQPFCTNDFENDLVGLQSLEVYSARQSWVQTLGKTLAYDQPLGQEGVAEVTLQSLKEWDKRKKKNGCAINQILTN